MYKNTFFFLILLTLMYGIIPYQISEALGSDFLIGDFKDKKLFFDLLIYTIATAFFLSPFFKKNIALPKINPLGKISGKIGYSIYFIYLLFLVFFGIYLRRQGYDREHLLSTLSNTFIQGMGMVMMLFYLKFITSGKRSILFAFLLFCFIDFLFMGKQYFIALVTILIFLADFHQYKVKLLHLVGILAASVLFIFGINFSRGDFTSIDLYSTFMEFRGVLSSIQFYRPDINLLNLNEFRSIIEKECFAIYGYNLAFHPLLYFRSISYEYTTLVTISYAIFVYFTIKIMIRLIGAFAVLIVALNFIHYLRHGIDIFLIKVLAQFLFVLLFRFKFDLKPTVNESTD